MQKRDVIIDTINHRQSAYVPWNIEMTQGFTQNTIDSRACVDSEIYFENHMLRRKYKKNCKLENGQELDLFGVTWEPSKDGGDVGNIVEYPLLGGDFEDYKFPEVDETFARQVIEQLLKDSQGRFSMFSITMGYFERLWSLFSMEEALANMIADEELTLEVLEKVEEHHHKLLDIALEYDELDAIYFADDWGQQNGLIMGPSHWRKLIKPGIKRIFEHVKSKNKYIVLHSCGDLREIMGDLVEMGVDVYNTVQPEIYDLDYLKREYGKDITFYGGISTQQFLPFATPEEVKKKTREVIEKLAGNGGYILSPTHAVTPDIPVENIEAMIEVAKEYM